MRSPVLTLAWETWQQGRKSAWCVLVITGLCALPGALAPDKSYLLDNYQAFYWLLMVCTLFLTFGIFHYAEHNPKRSWHGFPYRLFCLPVSTFTLVACPMALGVASVELIYWAWAELVFAPIGRTVSCWPGFCVGGAMICYQAIIWSLAGFRITRLIVLALTGLLFVNFAIVPYVLEINPWPVVKVFTVFSVLLTLLVVGAFFTAWYSVEQQRRGGGRGRGWLKAAVARIADTLPRRAGAFGSAAAAQLWFEWRRTGCLLPACTGGALTLVVLPLSWFTRSDHDSLALTLGWLYALPFLLAAAIGRGFVKPDFWSADISLPTFHAVRPISAGQLVVTKLKVAAWSVALSWTLVLGFAGLYLSFWANLAELQKLWNGALQIFRPAEAEAILVLLVVVGALLTWRAMVVGLWTGLSGSRTMYAGSAILQMAAVVFLVWGAIWFSQLFWTHLDQALRHLRWIGWALVAVAVTKLSAALVSWERVTPNRTRKYFAIWWGATFCFIGLVLAFDPSDRMLKHVLIMAAFLPVPLARLGFAPLFLAKNRHH